MISVSILFSAIVLHIDEAFDVANQTHPLASFRNRLQGREMFFFFFYCFYHICLRKCVSYFMKLSDKRPILITFFECFIGVNIKIRRQQCKLGYLFFSSVTEHKYMHNSINMFNKRFICVVEQKLIFGCGSVISIGYN